MKLAELDCLPCSNMQNLINLYTVIDGSTILHTLLVKHYNDLLDNQSSEQGKDEVTY